MPLLIVLCGILLLVFMIIRKVNAMLALIATSVITGLCLGMPVPKLLASMTSGIGSTMGSTILVIALGAMIGKLAEESGSAQKLVQVLVSKFGKKHIQWAILITGLLAGIPLFYNAGFVVLIPLVFATAATTGLPMLYVGLPMAAALSVTHGFLPPHPGPVALAGILGADIGRLLLYGMIIAIPTAILAGVVFSRFLPYSQLPKEGAIHFDTDKNKVLPSAFRSCLILLSPVVLIAAGTLGHLLLPGAFTPLWLLLQDPVIALLLSLTVTLLLLQWPMKRAMDSAGEGVKSVAMILLIIAAGGAFKQILVDSNVAALIQSRASLMHLSPLFLAWLIAALFRVTLGSATVAALTTAGLVAPFIQQGASPELMALSVGAGSLMCSHVNDTGFWMFKEYFGLTLKQTFMSWTLMESLISLLGLAGVMLLQLFA